MASEQKRLFMALSLSAFVLFTWQAYFAPKPQFEKTEKVATGASDKKVDGVSSQAKSGASPVAQTEEKPIVNEVPSNENYKVSSVVVSNGQSSMTLTSNLVIKDYFTINSNDPFSSVVGGKDAFKIFAMDNGKLVGIRLSNLKVEGTRVSGDDLGLGLTFDGNLDESGVLNWVISSRNPRQFYIKSQSEKMEGEGRQIRQFLAHMKDVKRVNIDDDEAYDGKLNWFGLDYHYHLFATVFKGKEVSAVNIKNEELTVKLIEPTGRLEASTYFLKKNYNQLKELNNNLHLSIDFGVFGVIAVPILKGLQFFYKYIPNYGLAIILITLLIRTILFPLQYKSFKSMKKMQKLQPELAKLKEKFKDDPPRMQKETMELFKRNGANPMGGCLPLVLQMPVFFAFYQVLFNSVELLNAPFVLWIHDLSAKDPYYVLPVLMGIAMFGQTKLNPSTTADPTQQKMMMFMPLIFTFFMKDLPAGLNLYIFVSTVFGIAQQLFVYKTAD